jgi:hypothetical protein
MIHNHWLSLTHHDSQPLVQHDNPWFTTKPVVVNYGELCLTSGCKSWCVMLSKWLWIMVCNIEQVVVSHGELSWASGCESCCAIAHHDSQPLAQLNPPWFTTFGTAWQSMIHNHWLIIAHHNSQPLPQNYTLWWIMVCYAKPVVVNHAVLYWFEGLWMMVCNVEPVAVNHGVLCWASGCESWCMIHSQWLSITHHDSQV